MGAGSRLTSSAARSCWRSASWLSRKSQRARSLTLTAQVQESQSRSQSFDTFLQLRSLWAYTPSALQNAISTQLQVPKHNSRCLQAPSMKLRNDRPLISEAPVYAQGRSAPGSGGANGWFRSYLGPGGMCVIWEFR